ncbi:hypothetical protein LOC68_14870 [Blastopirellula sp. JC732]|uniref:Carboxypeptidase regulatory-like domain-containing protein n=1 Tax=Blastopirellula sediminis TaxID=2894196 RepID=A0A9X1MM77_9BACT|nr:hypothetical protein [Blastopirellula sediminis]MCC9607034.1 hypothetical protein [Blastopirellula sediminis]MCC9629673.1 hypothetical protein [Blastopirellula sediminis]
MKQSRIHHGALLLLALATCTPALVGCGARGAPTAPVSGTVTVGGKPQANLVVSFMPQTGKLEAGKGSMGVTDAAGKYTLRTTDDEPRDGALIGKHKVVIRVRMEERSEDDPAAAQKPPLQLPAKAIDGSMEIEVTADGTTTADFQL